MSGVRSPLRPLTRGEPCPRNVGRARWSSRGGRPRLGMADDDVAAVAAGADLDAAVGLLGCLEVVEDPARRGVGVQPYGGVLRYADLDLTDGGVEVDRTGTDLTDTDVAAGGPGVDVRPCHIDRDVAVGRAHPEVATDRTDPAVTADVLHRRAAIDLADSDVPVRSDLSLAGHVVDGHLAAGGPELDAGGPLDADVSGRGLQPARADRTADDVPAPRGVALHVGAGRQRDEHLDRAVLAAEQVAQLRVLDLQLAVGELDDGLFGGLDVQLPRRVDRTDLDHGVRAVAGGEGDVAEDDVDGHGDRCGRVERGHGVAFLSGPCADHENHDPRPPCPRPATELTGRSPGLSP